MSNHSKAAKAARKMQKETGRSYCDCLQVVREKFAKEKEIREGLREGSIAPPHKLECDCMGCRGEG